MSNVQEPDVETEEGDEPDEEDDEESEAPPVDDVLSPSEYVEMFHPDTPTGPNGEPEYSTTSRSAFDQIWAGKGWQLRPDPYARPGEEQPLEPKPPTAGTAQPPPQPEPKPTKS